MWLDLQCTGCMMGKELNPMRGWEEAGWKKLSWGGNFCWREQLGMVEGQSAPND